MTRMLALWPFAALALLASLAPALAQGAGGGEADRGTGASGRSDGSGMGQDNTESGTPKGPGDKTTPDPAGRNVEKPAPGSPPDTPGLVTQCDDGRPPVEGACRN